MSTRSTTFVIEDREVSGLWDDPEPNAGTQGAQRPPWLILAHGAGGTMHTPALAQMASALAVRGIGVVRFNFLYTEQGRRAPDPQRRLERCYQAVAEEVRAATTHPPFLGGRSMGGRIGSHIAAADFPTPGLVLFSYPLHPPGKPERIRDAHLSDIAAPMLFIQGARDPFARPELRDATIGKLGTLHLVEGGDHSLKVRGRSPADVLDEIVTVTSRWIAQHREQEAPRNGSP